MAGQPEPLQVLAAGANPGLSVRYWLQGLGGSLLLSALLLFSGLASAYEIESLRVTHDGDDYRIVMQALIAAPPERVFSQLADLQALTKLNPSVTRVQVGEPDPQGRLPLSSEAEFCVLSVCRSLRHTQQVQIQPDSPGGRIDSQTVPPPASDFREGGEAHWQISAAPGGSRLGFEARLSPVIWLPPVVGPWAVQRRLREEAQLTVERLERLSQAAAL